MEILYKKNKNDQLLKQLETFTDSSQVQNYIPIYNRFFTMNNTNWNRFNLNNTRSLCSLEESVDNYFIGKTSDETIHVFFKYSPLLDPLKYLTGVYESYDFTLPTLTELSHPKINDVNNSSYVDSFFSYLTSHLLHSRKFIHGLDFYGSYLGVKNNFKYNIEDDLEQLQHSAYFNKNKNILYSLNQEDIFESGSRNYKEKLSLKDEDICFEAQELEELETTKPEFVPLEEVESLSNHDVEIELDSSSKSSNTDHEQEDTDDFEMDDHMQELSVTINRFPVQIIALERCTETLDSLLMKDMPMDELNAALMQVIMMLIVYQKEFQFTHNDLHTNNIMYISTDEPYVYYKYETIYYKVPTFGKIFKIIDFGRAIYTYKNKQFVSDSFSKEGDAATQYNIEPYFDTSKPRVEPNYSFDLCRLACSLIDMIPDDNPVYDMIMDWCNDDKGRNVVYKSNGEERYPDFKLYKMIVRTVHAHLPHVQLLRPNFQQYQCESAEIYMEI
jgi:hypothetical protein